MSAREDRHGLILVGQRATLVAFPILQPARVFGQ
jgi:hypothetical protein